MLRNIRKPHVFADHHAEGLASEGDRRGQGAGFENALLVKHAVIGQVVFERCRFDLAMLDQMQRDNG